MEDLEELFEAFSLFDKDYNGLITNKELGIVMRSISLNPTENEINEMISEVETSQKNLKQNEHNPNNENKPSDTIDFPEFLAFLSRKTIVDDKSDDEYFQRIFSLFASDTEQFITTESMIKLIEEVGEPINKEQIQKLINESDVDGDSKISFEGKYFFYLNLKNYLFTNKFNFRV